MIAKDLVLENERIRLEPLGLHRVEELFLAGNDSDLWDPCGRPNPVRSLTAATAYLEDALHGPMSATSVPFSIIDKRSGRAIGSTRFAEISEEHRRLEIGWTWIAKEFWRTHVNSDCKYLLLRHAFENAGVQRVQLKADCRNDRSRAAMLRLGATYEGTLRDFRIIAGMTRSVSYYSILRDEWPQIKARLEVRGGLQVN